MTLRKVDMDYFYSDTNIVSIPIDDGLEGLMRQIWNCRIKTVSSRLDDDTACIKFASAHQATHFQKMADEKSRLGLNYSIMPKMLGQGEKDGEYFLGGNFDFYVKVRFPRKSIGDLTHNLKKNLWKKQQIDDKRRQKARQK